MYKEEALYYPCRENNGADQLCNHCTADLPHCFRISKLLVFLCGGSYVYVSSLGTLAPDSLYSTTRDGTIGLAQEHNKNMSM